MCLAKVYLRSTSADSADELLMENVTRVVVKDDHVVLTSLLQATEDVAARIASIDLMENRLVLERVGE